MFYRNILSIILGLSLALLFRRACKGSNCVIITGPPNMEKVANTNFKYKDNCYKYTPVEVDCEHIE